MTMPDSVPARYETALSRAWQCAERSDVLLEANNNMAGIWSDAAQAWAAVALAAANHGN